MELQRLSTDVLVIGSGAAACMAALEATRFGASVLMVDRGRIGRSGSTTTAGAGTAAAFGHTVFGEPGNPDTLEQHFQDTVTKGRFLSDQERVRILVQEIRPLVDQLCELGVPYAKTSQGLYYQNQGVGQTYARNCTPKGNGAALTEIVAKELAWRGVTFLERTRVLKLLPGGDNVSAAVAVSTDLSSAYLIEAGATVLAAGSATALQKYASAAFKTTGDAFWLAHDAGAELANMEFLEFTFIPLVKGRAVPCGGSTQLTSRGAKFYNAEGERFMKRYNPETMEKTTRAVIINAFYKEMVGGRGPVTMDCGSISPELWEKWESMGHNFINFMRAAKVDYHKGQVQLVPALHCLLGGVNIDNWSRTKVPGLFAAGETTTGIHGAVRLGGAAFAECYVFGNRAGAQAAREALAKTASASDNKQNTNLAQVFLRELGEGKPVASDNLAKMLNNLKEQAWTSLSVIRNGKDIAAGRDFFADILEQYSTWQVITNDPEHLNVATTLRNLALTGLCSAASALAREETRGGHIRDDFPDERSDFLAWFINGKEDPGHCRRVPITSREGDLKP